MLGKDFILDFVTKFSPSVAGLIRCGSNDQITSGEFWMLALEDMVQALSVFLLYVGLPGLPLLLIGWLFGLWTWLAANAPWLLSS